MPDDQATPRFTGGVNIAMKIPKEDYEETVDFYRDVLRLDVKEVAETGTPTVSRTHSVQFGPNTLWLDCVDRYSQKDIWLELRTDNLDAATSRLAAAGIPTCDEIEDLPDMDVAGHWIKDPAGTVHLLAER